MSFVFMVLLATLSVPGRFGQRLPAAADLYSGQLVSELKRVRDGALAIGGGIVRASAGAEGADVSPIDALGVPTFAPIQDNRTYFNYLHTAATLWIKLFLVSWRRTLR